jgi:hypothetical protein
MRHPRHCTSGFSLLSPAGPVIGKQTGLNSVPLQGIFHVCGASHQILTNYALKTAGSIGILARL